MSVRLHINVDHVATLRNARGTQYPDPLLAAQICEAAGADGITAHLREDRRHIRDEDLEHLRNHVATLLNMEMAATPEMIAIAMRLKPDVVTLVPERREERTTEGGLDVAAQRSVVERAVREAKTTRIKVSLFVAADVSTIELASAIGADQVELHTGEYCEAETVAERAVQLDRLRRAAEKARQLGLDVAAGHGLTRHNVGSVVAIDAIREVNIGHSVMADAILFGLDRAVRDLREAIERGRGRWAP